MKKAEFKNLKIHPDLHKKLKMHSAKTGISLFALTEIATKMICRLSYHQLEQVVMEDFSNESAKLLDGLLKKSKNKTS